MERDAEYTTINSINSRGVSVEDVGLNSRVTSHPPSCLLPRFEFHPSSSTSLRSLTFADSLLPFGIYTILNKYASVYRHF